MLSACILPYFFLTTNSSQLPEAGHWAVLLHQSLHECTGRLLQYRFTSRPQHTTIHHHCSFLCHVLWVVKEGHGSLANHASCHDWTVSRFPTPPPPPPSTEKLKCINRSRTPFNMIMLSSMTGHSAAFCRSAVATVSVRTSLILSSPH